MPGTNIKILKEKYFNSKERKKGIIINLAWHISSEIEKYLKEKKIPYNIVTTSKINFNFYTFFNLIKVLFGILQSIFFILTIIYTNI